MGFAPLTSPAHHPKSILQHLFSNAEPAAGSLDTSAPLASNSPAFNTSQYPASPGEIRLTKLLTAGFFAVIFISLAIPFFSTLSWTTLVQDDFFYYLVVARNLVHGHGSTFNGIVNTNGYQPLWFACVALLSAFTDNSRLILGFVALSSFAASGAIFSLSSRLFRKAGARPLLAFALAAWLTASCLMLLCMGMEIILTLPLALAAVCLLYDEEWLLSSPLHTFYLGLLFAAMVLSRIDTLFFGALLLAGILLSPRLRTHITIRLLGGVLIGLSPVLIYFAFNHIYFHTWLPISGMAKQLKIDHHLSSLPLQTLREQFPGTVKLAVLSIAIAFILLPRLLSRISAMQRVIVTSLLIFPFVYYTVLSYVSDWPLWAWYWYAIRISFFGSLLVFCLAPAVRNFLQRPIVTGILILGVFLQVAVHPWKRDDFDIDDAAIRVHDFAATHPGVYAMGDRSGTVAYLLPYPMVQLEGLVMDTHFLDLLRAQTPLKNVLSEYHVRYYIATAFDDQPCFSAVEPRLAGPHSAHMQDEFCDPPILRFASHGKITLIYDLDASH